MTLREVAIKAMKEIGFSETRITNVLAYMDTDDPKQIGTNHEQIPHEAEASAMRAAKNFFQNHPSLPMDN